MKTKIKYKYHLLFTIIQQNKINCKLKKINFGNFTKCIKDLYVNLQNMKKNI